jgi:hypothetical protein
MNLVIVGMSFYFDFFVVLKCSKIDIAVRQYQELTQIYFGHDKIDGAGLFCGLRGLCGPALYLSVVWRQPPIFRIIRIGVDREPLMSACQRNRL